MVPEQTPSEQATSSAGPGPRSPAPSEPAGEIPPPSATPADIEALLGSLEASAAARSQAAESMGGIIAGVESRLSSLGIQMSFWVEDRPLSRHELSVSASTVARAPCIVR